ncbi:MAG: SDR family oxidoreductase [Chitinophagaceae bacterium]
MDSLNNKTVVITGASRGIGRAIALAMQVQGTRLALIARTESELLSLQQEIKSNGNQVLIFTGDISNETFVQESIDEVIRQFGCIDILINNAGMGIFKPAEDISLEEWNQVFDSNTKGSFLMSKAVIPIMKKQSAGHIINIASDVAKRVFAGGALYCASKYAQDAFSMAIRKELRPFKVKVSVVYSGLVDSYFHAEPQGDSSHHDWLKNEDMANAIVYIAAQPAHVVIDELMIHPISQDY